MDTLFLHGVRLGVNVKVRVGAFIPRILCILS